MANLEESDHEETEIAVAASPKQSDSDSDFEVPGKGKKKRAAKSKSSSNKRRNTMTPKFNKCHQCRQKLDDNPNLVSFLSSFIIFIKLLELHFTS